MTPHLLSCLTLSLALGACGDGAPDAFSKTALPVLEARCLSPACHGVGPDDTWPEQDGLFIAVDADGRATDVETARETALARVVTVAPAALSSLVRIPMAPERGGGPHFGGVGFSGRDDPGARALLRWIESEASGGEDATLTPLQQTFATTVMPTMIERCGQSGCHGPTDGSFAVFAPRTDQETGLAAPLDVRSAYKSARKHLDLWSDDPMRSRLIRKGLRITHGGLPHRRARFGIFPLEGLAAADAAAVKAVVAWARAERDALGVPHAPAPTDLLFVAGPAAPRAPFRIIPGPTGSDLYTTPWPVVPGAETNLTAALHPDGPAEVRDPAVSHDATRVVFSMRRQGETELRLWQMDLATGTATAVVDASIGGSFVQPTYAPDGRIIAAWDGHGLLGADAEGIAPELVAIDSAGAVQRLTYTPAPEVTPTFLAAGKTRGQLLFSTRRNSTRGPEGVLFRFPLSHNADFNVDPEYHAHFGASMAPTTPLSPRDLADGRQVIVGLESATVSDDRGALGIIDRSLGPIIGADDARLPSLEDYTPAVSWLDDTARYRDPAPLPDGRLLVAADSPAAPGEDAIYTVAFDDRPEVDPTFEVLVSRAGESVRSPTPVFTRPSETNPHPTVVSTEADKGYLVFRDLGTLETLYERVGPAGERVLRSDIASVRLLTPEGARASDVRYHSDGGTTTGLTRHIPARVMGEWPLPTDRSTWLQVPARTPLLVQLLDARGMAVGRPLDRWYYAEGNETIPGGTNPATYPKRCAGCHGSATGDPADEIAGLPDAVSSASITLSTHERRAPRKPLTPLVVSGTGTRVDYERVVGPLLVTSCATAGCHTGDAPAASLPLDTRAGTGRFPAAYEALVNGYVDRVTARARRSRLVERLVGEELDATEPVTGMCPPQGVAPGTLTAVVRWIESGAAYSLTAQEASVAQ